MLECMCAQYIEVNEICVMRPLFLLFAVAMSQPTWVLNGSSPIIPTLVMMGGE